MQMNNSGLCVWRVYYVVKCLLLFRSGMLSVLRVVYVIRRGGVIMCCYLCGYSLTCWYIVSYIGLFCSVPNSFICIFASLVRNIWYFSGLFRNFPFFVFPKIVNVFSIFPYIYICPESNMWREYPVSGRLLRMAWRCSLYLVLNVFCRLYLCLRLLVLLWRFLFHVLYMWILPIFCCHIFNRVCLFLVFVECV
jgi:hypothetical protein